MKFSFRTSLIYLVVAFFASTALAYPVNGYQPDEVVVRSQHPNVIAYLARRTNTEDIHVPIPEKAKKNPLAIFKQVFSKAKDPEEAAHRKEVDKAHKQYVQIGVDHAEAAKDAGRTDVIAHFTSGGHIAEALKAAKDGWHQDNHLKQFKYADVGTKTLKSGRLSFSVHYHNGPGTGPGVQMNFMG